MATIGGGSDIITMIVVSAGRYVSCQKQRPLLASVSDRMLLSTWSSSCITSYIECKTSGVIK